MRVCLDFDGVLHNPHDREPGHRMGKPVHGAAEACWSLSAQGHELVVHTARTSEERHVGHVADWLLYFHFPPMAISVCKPQADVYLDDKALRFVDWLSASDALARILDPH